LPAAICGMVGKERIAENVHLFGLRPIPINGSGLFRFWLNVFF
jgi:hypothetical protein